MQQRKFLFDLSFDGSGEPPTDEAAAAAERAAEKDEALAAALAAAREEGRQEGYARGIADAAESAAARQAEALAAVAAALERLLTEAEEAALVREREAARLAVAAARRMVPMLARTSGFAEIEAVVADCLRQALDEPRIVLRVAEEAFDEARQRIEPMAREAGFAGRMIILSDPELQAGDCRIEWADGGAERNTARLWRDIEHAVSQALAAPEFGVTADAA